MDCPSDSDCPEPTSVLVHPIPKEQPNITSAPNLPNQIPDTFPLSLPYLDHALPSPGLSSSMVTDNDPLEDDEEAHDSGVDVPLDGSAGALTGGSFDYPGEPDGLALDPPGRRKDVNPPPARPEVSVNEFPIPKGVNDIGWYSESHFIFHLIKRNNCSKRRKISTLIAVCATINQ